MGHGVLREGEIGKSEIQSLYIIICHSHLFLLTHQAMLIGNRINQQDMSGTTVTQMINEGGVEDTSSSDCRF